MLIPKPDDRSVFTYTAEFVQVFDGAGRRGWGSQQSSQPAQTPS